MRKPTLIIFAILISIALLIVNWYWFHRVHITPNDLIIEVNKDALSPNSQTELIAYYEKNKNDMKAIADYLLANEKLFGTRPVILNNSSREYIDKIADPKIKNAVDRLLKEGTVKEIHSLNDNIKNVYFQVGFEYGSYTQGIRYVSDEGTVSPKKVKYYYVEEAKSLGSGWFYYFNHHYEIKNADTYRKIVWDKMNDIDKKTVIDCEKAEVTLADWKTVSYKLDHKDREFVVAVTFKTNIDGLLGPITVYVDPVTKEIVGSQIRA
jgi:hypothetical protein